MKKYIPLYLLLLVNVACVAMDSPSLSRQPEKHAQIGEIIIEDADSAHSDSDSSDDSDNFTSHRSDKSPEEYTFVGQSFLRQMKENLCEKNGSLDMLQNILLLIKKENGDENRALRTKELRLKELELAYKIATEQHQEPVATLIKESQEHALQYFKRELPNVLSLGNSSNVSINDFLNMMMKY